MADVHKLIDSILADPRLATSRAFSGKVYGDEPILRTGSQMKNFLPERYKEMKALAKPAYDGFDYRRPSETKLFVTQACFMEQWEDDFPFTGTFSRYYPTYAMMNDQQLRGYFSWRTKVRKGAVEETSLSFAFVYIYELLNGIGGTPQECFDKLYAFWTAYRRFSPELNRYMESWLRDFVIYHDLPARLIETFIDTSFEQALSVLRHAEATYLSPEVSPDELYGALSSLSAYRIERSVFAKEHASDIANVACRTFYDLCAHCAKHRKKGLVDSWFGARDTSPHPMFSAAVFYEDRPHEDCLYRVNDVHAYSCRGGRWSGLRRYKNATRNAELGAMLATIDRLMRQAVGFERAIKEQQVPKYLHRMIEGNVSAWAAAKKQAEQRRVRIDRSQLAGIRSRAAITREQLLVEEERFEGPVETDDSVLDLASTEQSGSLGALVRVNDQPQEAHFTELVSSEREDALVGPTVIDDENEHGQLPSAADEYGITEAERAFVSALVLGGSDASACLDGESEDMVVDSINEKFFDLLGDTALEYGADGVQIVEEYEDDVKGALGL